MKRYLVTGDKGYIGSLLVKKLLDRGDVVIGIDTGYFEESSLDIRTNMKQYLSFNKDIRDIDEKILEGVDVVVHLAALCNDPISNLNSKWTKEINIDASTKLAQLSKKCGVKRFIFSSSCIVYGDTDVEVVDETTPVKPNTLYANSKVEVENEIMKIGDSDFATVSLRNGTVYGLTKYMRFDTVTNDFVGSAITTGKINIRGNGMQWRPIVHVEDVCGSVIMISEAQNEKIRGQIFNIGNSKLNIQIKILAELVAEIIEGTEVSIIDELNADQRSYRASFEKFSKSFPDFDFKYDPKSGIEKLFNDLKGVNLSSEDYLSGKFIRLKQLSELLSDKKLDNSLMWVK